MESNVLAVETRRLDCPLSDEELQGLSQELAQSIQDRQAEEERQQTQRADMKKRLSEFEEKAKRLSNNIVRRSIARDVSVRLLLDGINVKEVRGDTGEILLTRPATVQELQAPMREI